MTVSTTNALSLAASTLECMAARYASLAEPDGEQAIDTHALMAIRSHRIDDLVFWQRVRFRARLLRTIEQRKVSADRAGHTDQP